VAKENSSKMSKYTRLIKFMKFLKLRWLLDLVNVKMKNLLKLTYQKIN